MKITEYGFKLAVRYKNHHISSLASQLAFDILFSSFPFLMLTMVLIGFINVDPVQIISILNNIMPEQVYELVSNIAIELFQTRSGNLLSASIIFALYSASRAFRAIRYGLNRAYNEEESKNMIKVIVLSVVFMITISFMIIFVLTFIVFGEKIGYALVHWLGLNEVIVDYLKWLRYPVGLLGMITVFSLIYKLVPSRKIRILEAIPGAIFTSVVWIVFSAGFAFYVNNYGKYTYLYGSIGVIIILLIWLQITSTTILLGGELNALIDYEKKYKVH